MSHDCGCPFCGLRRLERCCLNCGKRNLGIWDDYTWSDENGGVVSPLCRECFYRICPDFVEAGGT